MWFRYLIKRKTTLHSKNWACLVIKWPILNFFYYWSLNFFFIIIHSLFSLIMLPYRLRFQIKLNFVWRNVSTLQLCSILNLQHLINCFNSLNHSYPRMTHLSNFLEQISIFKSFSPVDLRYSKKVGYKI